MHPEKLALKKTEVLIAKLSFDHLREKETNSEIKSP
jgi:hypothetical protein